MRLRGRQIRAGLATLEFVLVLPVLLWLFLLIWGFGKTHIARSHAIVKAKNAGKVRYVGFTGHKDPEIHLRMLSYGFAFDACQLPLNGFDAHFRSFQTQVLPQLARRGIAPIGMKSLGGDGRVVKKKAATIDAALRYAMSLPVCTTVSGIDSLKVLRQNLRIAAGFEPMSDRERLAYEKSLREFATDGRFELYKTTAEHEGKVGRRQHGYPSEEEMAG